jgi:hypothetical protein
VPTVPALEYAVTAEAGGETRIHGGFLGLLPSVSGALTHDDPQSCKGNLERPCIGPDTLSTSTGED